ncbi:hypothetical protein LPJ77_001412 [Coemansia sp. RSA 2523]|nr:hypothetical protein LPJ58_000597 [Coemansia sp. RSA 1591]KAJ1766852.1 hypothetical protein LPJ69_000712 [Coemansia sp. RSA 1752]KAJ1779442.1 hypothetical protein LPJ54_000922 [Coemansia sp. RSA 1824]KAJ1790642.1 hypothetical protein LPJ62_001826 [Coemansia sp. RSA 2167]KAJ1794682.1 hypothetical protein LPJ67_000574 [Coemansia sp. RSA 1938]KAJ1809758.1 hypothetical protein LPJ77_001412 [Coemansia sp. RSA 2523]KAJ2132287.1 hypothetical protein GGF48_001034 [Coemansia sp. RSA 921]KAJ2142355
MRESNFHFPAANKACVSITSALYDRRALDCTADLPLVNSLSHLNYLTSSSVRIREILTTDGGLERLVRILRTTRVTEDTLHNWKWTMAFQCVVNVGVRGTAEIRQRVVQVGAVPILLEVLHAYLLGAEFARLEQKLREAMSAQAGRLPLSKIMDFTGDPGLPSAEDHAGVGDPSNMVVSGQILASGANNSTGFSPPRPLSTAARSNAQAAAAAAVAAVSATSPIPVVQAARQQTRRVGEGVHPLARHVAYPDAAPAASVAGIPSQLLPYANHAYMYSEQERLQAEYDAVRRRLQAITHVMYRHDDVVLTLQLLAYLSKTPGQRQLLHECPLLHTQVQAGQSSSVGDEYAGVGDLADATQAAWSAAQANAAAGVPPVRRHATAGTLVDVIAVVEKFTAHDTFPSDMVYWSSIVMRNSCRRDESRNNCRQCAHLKCQKWERHPNEFSKCRRCRKAKYCSKQCQSSAWQECHRNWCTERSPTTANPPGTVAEMQQNQQPVYAAPQPAAAPPFASAVVQAPESPGRAAQAPASFVEQPIAGAQHRQSVGGPVASSPHASHTHHPYRRPHAEPPASPLARARPRRRVAD